jgi:hypothetical protein
MAIDMGAMYLAMLLHLSAEVVYCQEDVRVRFYHRRRGVEGVAAIIDRALVVTPLLYLDGGESKLADVHQTSIYPFQFAPIGRDGGYVGKEEAS